MRKRRHARGRKSLISVTGIEQIEAAVLAMRAADKDLRKDINARARDVMGPEWTKGLASHLTGPYDRLATQGARIGTGNPPTLIAGNSKRPLLGKGKKRKRPLTPTDHWAGAEYGATRSFASPYNRTSPKGRLHYLRRHTRLHMAERQENGRIIGPTVRDLLPRLASLWVQSIVRTYLDAAEGKK